MCKPLVSAKPQFGSDTAFSGALGARPEVAEDVIPVVGAGLEQPIINNGAQARRLEKCLILRLCNFSYTVSYQFLCLCTFALRAAKQFGLLKTEIGIKQKENAIGRAWRLIHLSLFIHDYLRRIFSGRLATFLALNRADV